MPKKKPSTPSINPGPNNVILVWEEVPESTKVFRLAVDDDSLVMLKRTHFKYANTIGLAAAEETALNVLSDYLDGRDAEPEAPLAVENGTLIVCGFIL